MGKKHTDIISGYSNKLLSLEHVVGVGYGKKEKNGQKTDKEAIIVLVDQKLPESRLNNKDLIPLSLESYKTDVMEIGTIEFHELRTEKMRPARPGISIGHYKISAGTLGAVVRDRKNGELLILSNNHVLANITNGHDGRSKVGDPILQPGSYDNGIKPDDIIAHLERFIPLERGGDGDEPTCPIAISVEKFVNVFLHLFKSDYNFKLLKQGDKNKVDCAVARPIKDKYLDDSIVEIGRVKGIKEPEVGMTVQKSGRTSGLTEGDIRAIDASVQVQMSQTEVAVFDNQIITDPMSQPGDSGSLVLDKNNNAVGLLFAGSDKATICNKIGNVLDALEIEF